MMRVHALAFVRLCRNTLPRACLPQARALANACSKSGHRISFFMRKGADCLSKWVGEAERQLRLLFEQARRHQVIKCSVCRTLVSSIYRTSKNFPSVAPIPRTLTSRKHPCLR